MSTNYNLTARHQTPQTAHEGYVMVDHRACAGLQPKGMPAFFEAAMLCCAHCGQPMIKNPERKRARGSCRPCGGKFICDVCVAISRRPDYVHRSLAELKELVATGKVAIIGGTIAEPQLLWLKGAP